MDKNKPAALMSYAHSDDTDRHLTTFRERLSQEVQVQIGQEFPIFQDTKDIQWGQSWEQRINASLDEVSFLIPIITPSFFNSGPCRAELERFMNREWNQGRDDLILPIYFVETELISDPEVCATDELAKVIASRQYVDWRDFRFEPFTNPQVRKKLAELAVQIRKALPRAQMILQPLAPPRVASEPEPVIATPSGTRSEPAESPTAKREPPIRIVDPMLRGDFATISGAIEAVEPGTRILVRPGLYPEALVINKPLEIIGDGEPGDVIVQVAGKHVIQFQTTMGRVVNLTLRQMGGENFFCVDIAQGRLELEDCDITSQSLSCIAIHNDADPRLRRNRIHDSSQNGVFVFKGGLGTIEDNDIFNNAFSDVEIKSSGNPTLRRNRIHDSKRYGGILVQGGGQGTIEDNDIFGSGTAGVEIRDTGNPTLRRNRIHHSKEGGVYVHDGGHGTIEDNDIFSNANSGVLSMSAGNPMVRNNRINKNGKFGVLITENGGGTFEDNDLSENALGAWSIEKDCEPNITRTNNKEYRVPHPFTTP